VLLAAVASTDEAGPGPRLIRGRTPPRGRRGWGRGSGNGSRSSFVLPGVAGGPVVPRPVASPGTDRPRGEGV